jgi:hypothetical protein
MKTQWTSVDTRETQIKITLLSYQMPEHWPELQSSAQCKPGLLKTLEVAAGGVGIVGPQVLTT